MSSRGSDVDHSTATPAPSSEPPDAALLRQLRNGDEQAFADLVSAWSPMMLRVARNFVSTEASAQEVVQETWLAVIRGLDRFEARSSLRTWVLAILSNLARTRGVREARTVPWSSFDRGDQTEPAVDRGRFRGPDDPWPGHWTPLGAPRRWEPSPEDRTVAREIRTELSVAIDELPERQRTVISLRDVHGLSSEEVCSLLGLTAGNQRVLLHRGRSRLRRRLEVFYGEAAGA